MFYQKIYGTVGYNTCTLQCSTFGQFQFHGKVSLVFNRKEAGRNHTVEHKDEYNHHTKTGNNASGVFHNTTDKLHILAVSYIQPMIDARKDSVLRFIGVFGFQNE